jgi:hypothetical protein
MVQASPASRVGVGNLKHMDQMAPGHGKRKGHADRGIGAAVPPAYRCGALQVSGTPQPVCPHGHAAPSRSHGIRPPNQPDTV